MSITISKTIVHEIPEGRFSSKDITDMTLSTALTPLKAETKRFITNNMLKIALRRPRDIKADVNTSSNTPVFATQILKDESSDFIKASQSIAQNLYRSQTSNSPSGILVVARVDWDGKNALLLMKAEHQEGMRLRRDEGTGRLDLEHLNELIVGHNSKVYKIAVLNLADDGTIVGQMVDQQNGVQFADFFLASFLGCELADKAELHTKAFMEASLKHFNKKLPDPVKASRYAGALTAYMHSQSPTFQPSDFADSFLDPEDRDDFMDAMPDSVGDKVIRKELKLVTGGGSGVRIIGHGFSVVASDEAFRSGKISVSKTEDGETVVKLSGDLKQLSFGALPKGSRE